MGQDEHAHDEDRRLMLAAAAGDRHAFEQIYAKYYPIVCDFIASRNGTCTPVADLAQEVFTRVWAGLERYKPGSSVKTFLLGVAYNVVREEGRKAGSAEARRLERLDSQRSHTESDAESPVHAAAQQEQLRALRATIVALPPKQREALELTHIEGVSPVGAAAAAGCSVATFRKRVRRALEHLARLLDEA